MGDFRDYGIEIRHTPNDNGDVKCACPKCGDGRRSARDLSVNVQKGTWHCFRCGYADGFRESDERRDPRHFTRLVDERPSERTYAKPGDVERDGELPKGIAEWFAARKIDPDVVERAGIGWGMEWMPIHDAKVLTIQFPYVVNGETVNIKYRAADVVTPDGKRKKSLRMVKDARLAMYNLDACRDMDQVAIVEGEPDALACMTAGIAAVMSVPNGAPAPGSTKFSGMDQYMASAAEVLARAETVVIATDGDEPGNLLASELARRIGRRKCYRVTWPEWCKDANDVLVAHGQDVLRQCFADAAPWPIEGVIKPSDLRSLVILLREHGLDEGVSTGFANLDACWRPVLGQFTTFTGVPSHGKSEFVNHLMVNLMRQHDWRCAVFTPESWPPQKYISQLCEVLVGAPLRVVRGHEARQTMSLGQLDRALEFLEAHIALVQPAEQTVDAILDAAGELVLSEGVQFVLIDPFTEIDSGGTENTHKWIGDQISKIRRFGRDKGPHMGVIAHPTKLPKVESERGGYEMPVVGPYDIAGSSHWANKSDNILTVRRFPSEPMLPTEVHVTKVRQRDNGQPGIAYFDFDLPSRRYTPTNAPVRAS